MLYLTVESENDFSGADDQSSHPTTPEDDTSGTALDGLCSNSGVAGFDGGVAVDDGAGSGMSLCIFVLLVLLDLCFRFTRERRGGRGW